MKNNHVGFSAPYEEKCPGDLRTVGTIIKMTDSEHPITKNGVYQAEDGEMKSCPPPTSGHIPCSVNKGKNVHV